MHLIKHILRMGALAFLGAGALGCAKTKIIPDEELARIFRDAMVTNSYAQNHPLRLDSLNIYEPIFAKYGYTTEDVQFTIGSFAKRKSARMSNVVDLTISMLEAESRFYQRRVAIIDSIGQLARERYAEVVYTDSVISVRRVADTSLLRIDIPLKQPGTYEVSYDYRVDSIDGNPNIRTNHYLVDERGRQSGSVSRRLKREEKDHLTASFVADERHRKLVLDMNGYPSEGMKKPHLTIDSLVVRRYLPDREARDRMARGYLDFHRLDSLSHPEKWYPWPDTLRYIIHRP